MKKFCRPCLLLLGMCLLLATPHSFVFGQADPAVLTKEFEALKSFRTYYYAELETLETHQFEVWFHNEENGWGSILVAADKNTNTANFTKEDYLLDQTVRAGWAEPDPSYTPVPQALESVSVGIVESYKKNFPQRKFDKFEIHYLGYFARVTLHEIVPSKVTLDNASQKPTSRKAITYQQSLAVSSKANSVTVLSRGGGSSSYRPLLALDFINPQVKFAQWVDHQLPAEWEGSSLLSIYLEPIS